MCERKKTESTGCKRTGLNADSVCRGRIYIINIRKIKQLHEQYKVAVKGYEKEPDNGLQDVIIEADLLPVIELI